MFDKRREPFSTTTRAIADRRPAGSGPKRLSPQPSRPLSAPGTTRSTTVNKTADASKPGYRSTSATPSRLAANSNVAGEPKKRANSTTVQPAPVRPGLQSRKTSDSSGSASDSSEGSSTNSTLSSRSQRLQRAVIAPPVEPPRITPKRTTLTGKTSTVKVKLPGAKSSVLDAGASPKTDKCKNCQKRSVSIDPVAMEIQANDKALRKIMDLEIHNQSLLAVNSSLENTIRQQAQEMEELRAELERLAALQEAASPVASAAEPVVLESAQLPSTPVDEPSITPADSTLEEDEHSEAAFARVCAMMRQMIEDGNSALAYRVPGEYFEQHDSTDGQLSARRTLSRQSSRSTLGRTPGALRTRSSSSSLTDDLSTGSFGTVASVPMKVKVHRRPSVSSGSDSGSQISSASQSSSSSRNTNKSIPKNKKEPHKRNNKDAVSRRLSIVMRPVVDTPAHAYLDDPYASFDGNTPSTAMTNHLQSKSFGSLTRHNRRTTFEVDDDDMQSLLCA
ncbi:hypothetical protein HDU85_002560 [Gaertneriomyces sp. JEL0708]|nr:hypothetical protein HDU85_002560 [Gaertneriomyces sp. JEL0708]